jgi:hypothetical protein
MTDRNGTVITVGSRAVLMPRKNDLDLGGKVGEVRAMKDRCGALRDKPGVRVADGPEGDPHWSAWVSPSEIVVVK